MCAGVPTASAYFGRRMPFGNPASQRHHEEPFLNNLRLVDQVDGQAALVAEVVMKNLSEVFAGRSGGIAGEMVVRIIFPDRFNGFVGASEFSDKAWGLDQKRPLVGDGVCPLVAQYVCQVRVSSEDEIGKLCPGESRDVYVSLIPAIAGQGRGDPINIDSIETGFP